MEGTHNLDSQLKAEQEITNNQQSNTSESMKEDIEKRKESALKIYNDELVRINALTSDRLKERSLQQVQENYDKEIDSCNQLLEKISKE